MRQARHLDIVLVSEHELNTMTHDRIFEVLS